MSKVRLTIGIDGSRSDPPAGTRRTRLGRLVRVMFYLPGFMGLLLIKTGEPASFGSRWNY